MKLQIIPMKDSKRQERLKKHHIADENYQKYKLLFLQQGFSEAQYDFAISRKGGLNRAKAILKYRDCLLNKNFSLQQIIQMISLAGHTGLIELFISHCDEWLKKYSPQELADIFGKHSNRYNLMLIIHHQKKLEALAYTPSDIASILKKNNGFSLLRRIIDEHIPNTYTRTSALLEMDAPSLPVSDIASSPLLQPQLSMFHPMEEEVTKPDPDLDPHFLNELDDFWMHP